MVVVSIQIKDHLVEYMKHKYSVENEDYVSIPSSDDLYYVLNKLRSKKPKDSVVNRGNLKFVVPTPRGCRDPEIYNHYSNEAIQTIQSRINRHFKAEFHDFMDYRTDECGDTITEATILFVSIMKLTAIEPDSLSKDYYRWRNKHRHRHKTRPYKFRRKEA